MPLDKQHSADLIVVGVDGSKAGLTAAGWAIDEAIHRKARLRLVYVITAEDQDCPPEMDYAQQDLRTRVQRRAARSVRAAEVPMSKYLETRGAVDMLCAGHPRIAGSGWRGSRGGA